MQNPPDELMAALRAAERDLTALDHRDATPTDPHPAGPLTADEIRERHKANVLRRADEAIRRARHVDRQADLFRFSDEMAARWHAQEVRSDPYYAAVRALMWGPGIYWALRQLRDRLTEAERKAFFAVKELCVTNDEMSDFDACGVVADRLGKAQRTVWNQYQAATKKVDEIVAEASAA